MNTTQPRTRTTDRFAHCPPPCGPRRKPHTARACAVVAPLLLLIAASTLAATYHVDYDGGSDDRDGLTPASAFRHAPGDPAATERAAKVVPLPGDRILFKGGVVYAGRITLSFPGTDAAPIVYDGNRDGDWGQGPAIIDGSVPLTNLRVCTSTEEAGGNPHYRQIHWTTVPKGARWDRINLCQGTRILAVAQDPNPKSPIYQEDLDYYHRITTEHVPLRGASLQVRALNRMGVNAQRPLIAMFDGGNHSAVIENIAGGGEVEVVLPEAVNVTAFAVTPQIGYTTPKGMVFVGDGKELLTVELHPPGKRSAPQRFALTTPATFQKLVIRFVSAHGKDGAAPEKWGAVQSIAALDAGDKNVLLARQWGELRNAAVFNQTDPDFYRNAVVGVHTSPNFVFYKRILRFEPQEHRITFEPFAYREEPYSRGGAFAIFNSPRHIDTPGEYALSLDPEPDGTHKLYVWPFEGSEGMTRSIHGEGLTVNADHLIIQNFWIRKQGGSGITGTRKTGTGLILRDVKVSHVRSRGIYLSGINDVLVENCEVTDNPGHAKGIFIRNARNIVVRGCTLRRNSSTALDYYTIRNGVVQDCLVDDNRGMHANGLTFYVGCEDILVERNHVRNGHVGLTLHGGRNMIVRNNIIEGGRGGSYAIGLWAGPAFDNLLIVNNILRHWGAADSSNAAVYGGNTASKGCAIINNIIDGICGNVILKADLHHNLFTKTGPGVTPERLGNNRLVEDRATIFLNPEGDDWRLKPAGPAIGTGVAVASLNRYDRAGVDRFADSKVDIGPYEAVPEGQTPPVTLIVADPQTFRFDFDGYEIVQPTPIETVYTLRFPRREGAAEIVRKGIDRTGEGDGKVNLRADGYISGWGTPGHWLEWTVDVEEAGAFEVVIEHGSEEPGKRSVLVNGKPVEGLDGASFPATGAWVAWQETGLEKPLLLNAGSNRVRFVHVSGHHNFRTLRFIPVKVTKE